MENPRRKLGTNLGPAPAFSVFAHAPATAPVVATVAMSSPPHNEHQIEQEVAFGPVVERSPAQPTVSPKPPKATKPTSPALRSPKSAPPQKQTELAEQATVGRTHGTFSDPYARKTDGAQTRQTTLTVDLELDDRFESFFRRNRRHYRTRSSVWAAAMAHFLDSQNR